MRKTRVNLSVDEKRAGAPRAGGPQKKEKRATDEST